MELIMQIQKIKVSDLKLDLNNLRGHNEEEVRLLTRSLTIFGQYKPLIIDKDTMIVKVGNGRLMAMRELGWKECDCILLDWSDKKGLEIIDNRLNELSSWVDKDLKIWFKNKGKDWWGVDKLIESKVEKYINSEIKEKSQTKEKEQKLCPNCGKPLTKKKTLFLD